MNNERKELSKITSKLDGLDNQIAALEQDESVKKYIALKAEEAKLIAKRDALVKSICDETYRMCAHIFVKPYESNGIEENKCLKCGLGPRKDSFRSAIYSNIKCDYDLARKIFGKIKAENPNMPDVQVLGILKTTLREIELRETNSENKKPSR